MTPIDLARAATELVLAPLDRLPSAAALIAVSVASGVMALWAVRRTTDQRALGVARDRLTAGLLEVRLYLDSPRRVLAAQGRVLRWTLRYLARATPALLLLAVPFTLLFTHLYVRHEVAPLAVGAPALVRIDADAAAPPTIEAGPDVAVGPSFLAADGTLYARVTPRTAGEHRVRLGIGGSTVEKLLVVGAGTPSPERRGGLASLWALGTERALTGAARSVRVEHPATPPAAIPWWATWLILSTGTALVLRRPMKVVI